MRFGFDRKNSDILRAALVAHAAVNEVSQARETPFGTIFEINGPLVAPDGRTPFVLVVWMIEFGENCPRLVTAVPSEEYSP